MNHPKSLTCSLQLGLLFLQLCFAELTAPAVARAASQAERVTQADRAERIALHQALLDLSNPWTVMCVAAHPDDEDGATLTVLRRKYGVHTVTVFSTYGEGGQNATGPELYEELGAIRARETLSASEIQGSEASFLALRDFGFSKSAAETFRIWGQEEALRRLVLKIRTLRPDVIITNHDTSRGHGHHQATGRLVMEAFDAAADARRFPEQLRQPGVRLWQAQRLFVRVSYESGNVNKAEEEAAESAGRIITVNPNERDEVRRTTYAEQALEALRRHASQGPWPQTVPQAGAPLIRYRLAREAKTAAGLPTGASFFLDGLRLPADEAAKLAAPTMDGRPLVDFVGSPHLVLDALATAHNNGWPVSQQLPGATARAERMRERLGRALAAASGLGITVSPDAPALVPGTTTTFNVSFVNKGEREIWLNNASLKWVVPPFEAAFIGDDNVRLAPGKTITFKVARATPKGAQINLPRAEHLYDDRLFGEHFLVSLDYSVGQVKLARLNSANQIDVAPRVEIAHVSPSPLVITPAALRRSNRITVFNLRLINHGPEFKGLVNVEGLARGVRQGQALLNLRPNEALEEKVEVHRAFSILTFRRNRKQPLPNTISFSVFSRGSTIIRKQIQVFYSDAEAAPNLRVGYFRSFDDTLPNALSALNVEAQALTMEDVRAGDLRRFDTIIIDNRGYQAHPELIGANSRLLEYVQAGGTLIVFYHKANEWNPDPQRQRPQLAPYPILLGTARVTDENAAVVFTEPQSELLNFPNKIGAEDFKGWVQERGLYYPKEWAPQYSAPLSTGDAGETPLRGGLLAASVGRGRYIYTSMVWYRQLRAGVPGAYRLFANMISYGHSTRKPQVAKAP